MGGRLERSEAKIFDQIVHGLNSNVRQMVVRRDIKTVPELIRIARIAEENTNASTTVYASNTYDGRNKSK